MTKAVRSLIIGEGSLIRMPNCLRGFAARQGSSELARVTFGARVATTVGQGDKRGVIDPTTSDLFRVRAAKSGKVDAFAAMLQRHRPLLMALCRSMLDDGALAEDAAQEASLRP